MQKLNHRVLSIGADTGVLDQTISVPVTLAIPTMSNGALPKYLHISVGGGLASHWYTVTPKVGALNGASATGFPLAERNMNSVILNVSGYTHIGIDVGDAGGGGAVKLFPLEDF